MKRVKEKQIEMKETEDKNYERRVKVRRQDMKDDNAKCLKDLNIEPALIWVGSKQFG